MAGISSLPDVADLLQRQDGVVARSQVLAAGMQPHDIARLVRRREWVVLQPGVYLDHTGVPTWRQRAWAGVLGLWPAALFGESALRAADGTTPGRVVHVAIDRRRGRPKEVPGVRVHFVVDLERRTLWNLGPPRMRYEEAVLDVAAGARDDLGAIAALTSACGGRRTTADKLLAALAGRPRIARRRWIAAVLADAAAGTHSVLEHGWRELERAHGLPRACRQVRELTSTGVVHRDASYGERVVVELDGSSSHSSWADREADMARDLDLAATGGATVRLGYRLVLGTGCRTTASVVRFLRSQGIVVTPRPCRPGCPVADVVVPETTVPQI